MYENPKTFERDSSARSHATIDSIFSGQLVSFVVCQACMAQTHRMEHFLDLSLPVPEDMPTRPKRLCGTDADEEEGGEYVLASSKFWDQGWKTDRLLVPFRPGALFSVASYPRPGLSP